MCGCCFRSILHCTITHYNSIHRRKQSLASRRHLQKPRELAISVRHVHVAPRSQRLDNVPQCGEALVDLSAFLRSRWLQVVSCGVGRGVGDTAVEPRCCWYHSGKVSGGCTKETETYLLLYTNTKQRRRWGWRPRRDHAVLCCAHVLLCPTNEKEKEKRSCRSTPGPSCQAIVHNTLQVHHLFLISSLATARW